MYADDVQLYLKFKPSASSSSSVVTSMQNCIEEIRLWMTNNMLKLNDSKTEFLFLQKKNQLPFNSIRQLSIGNSIVQPSSKDRNLGVILDQELTMQPHVSSVCRSAYYHLRNIAKIRNFLTQSAAQSRVHPFVTSRIDSCNSLLYGVSTTILHKLQRVQNSAARLVKRVGKCEHITPILSELHWLPVTHRIIFKVLLLTFKALHIYI